MLRMPLPGRIAAWVAASLMLCATYCMSHVQPDINPALKCSLTLPPKIKLGEPIPLSFTLENTGSTALKVLNWNTPLEGFFGKYLSIAGPSGEVRYEGPMVKRGAPEADEYVTIAAGGKAQATVDLALPYRLTKAGRYTVTFKGSLFDVTTEPVPRSSDKLAGMKLSCPAATFELQAPPRQ
jgi:peptidyl-Lys metalloendopeptidase